MCIVKYQIIDSFSYDAYSPWESTVAGIEETKGVIIINCYKVKSQFDDSIFCLSLL